MTHLVATWGKLAAAAEEDHGPLYHGTDRGTALMIRGQGFKIPKENLGRGQDYGRAVYLTNDKDFARSYGRAVVGATLKSGTRIANLQREESGPLMEDAARYAGLKRGPYNEHGWWGDVHSSVDGHAIERAAKEHGYHGVTDGYVYALYHPDRLEVQE